MRRAVDDAVESAFGTARTEVAAAGGEGAAVVEVARRAATGGKRLRARLCLAAAAALAPRSGDATDGPSAIDVPGVLGAAAALELFQAAALVHDDLMDASDTRRGAASAHRFLEAEHFPASKDGTATRAREHFGSSGALLVGDLLLTMSASVLHAAVLPLERDTARAALATYSAMASEVAVGQYLDLLASHAPWPTDPGDGVDLERAERVIHAKSARYSVELPLHLGGVLAGADDDALAWLGRIGRAVGTAFQLRDDVLGVFGDPAVTGKPAGDDLREGKRTVLVALADARAQPQDRATLRENLGRTDLDPDDIATLRGILERTGALAEVERRIADLVAAAEDDLARPPSGAGDLGVLRALLAAAVDRSS
ncbi:hypothetical protein GCM10025875_14620 [Litorihabitans aurantiacus]|uniref:Polyprenyl synthetase family protein n=1 Tax=Litorihabitans aurantiacus TaxID=1930061 RepID=A0AA37XE08_9MICO|nr:hypothetical protein GCM10025875_14620 [Litorihabitans aurantiacus]